MDKVRDREDKDVTATDYVQQNEGLGLTNIFYREMVRSTRLGMKGT